MRLNWDIFFMKDMTLSQTYCYKAWQDWEVRRHTVRISKIIVRHSSKLRWRNEVCGLNSPNHRVLQDTFESGNKDNFTTKSKGNWSKQWSRRSILPKLVFTSHKKDTSVCCSSQKCRLWCCLRKMRVIIQLCRRINEEQCEGNQVDIVIKFSPKRSRCAYLYI